MSNLSLCIRVDDEIELRLNELRYAEEYLAVTLRNIEQLREWIPWAAYEQLDEVKAYMRRSMQAYVDGTCLPTNLWYRGQLVGYMGYPRMSGAMRMAEIGYWLDKDAQGKGLITRATRALVTYAFQEYGLNRVEIYAAEGNTRSRAVPERLGFTQEGIQREGAWINGKAHDLVMYGMLAREWQR